MGLHPSKLLLTGGSVTLDMLARAAACWAEAAVFDFFFLSPPSAAADVEGIEVEELDLDWAAPLPLAPRPLPLTPATPEATLPLRGLDLALSLADVMSSPISSSESVMGGGCFSW